MDINWVNIMKLSAYWILPALAGLQLCADRPAQAVDWTHCANNGGQCSIEWYLPAVVRYGHPDHGYFYYSVAGLEKLPCSNFNGDPTGGAAGKTCAYTPNSLGFSDGAIVLKPVANENQTVNWTESLRWVNYGLAKSITNAGKGTWWNTLQAQTWTCSNAALNLDPTPGQPPKKCYEGMPVAVETLKSGAPDWRFCAMEKMTDCVIPYELKNAPIVLRYGANNKWTYRIATLAKGSIKCETASFNEDPIKVTKECWYVPIVPPVHITGEWKKIIDKPEGMLTDGDFKFQSQYGTSYAPNDNGVVMNNWKDLVVDSIAKNGLTVVNGAKVPLSYAQLFAYNFSFEKSLVNGLGLIPKSARAHQGRPFVIYGFSTSATATCLREGSCDKTTYTGDYLLVENPPPFGDYEGPQCLPNTCGNDLCTVCEYFE